jgi:formylglycine-generating enzyme required for sulfatase activity
VALKQIQDRPANPRALEQTIPDHISKAILRCLEKDPAKRFQTVEEVQAAILHPSSSQKISSTVHKDAPRTAVWLTGIAAILMAAGFIIFGRQASTETPLTPSGAEFAAFNMAESLGTQEAWNTFLENYQKGELASVARQRIFELQVREDRRNRSDRKTAAIVAKTGASNPPMPVPNAADPASRQKWSLIDTVAIPGGVFMMGNDGGRGDEKPRHQVRLDGFRMSRSEITNRQYLAFLEDTGRSRPRDPSFARNYLMAHPDLPVVNVNYDDAVAFCKWAGSKLGMLVRLPTEAEWEYAARAQNGDSDYPWGNSPAKSWARYRDNTALGVPTVPRDTFPANDFGLYNMNGNVWEWVSDFYSKDYYNVSAVRNPTGPPTGTKRIIRGGSWAEDETQLANSHRSSHDPKAYSDQIGFRIVIQTSGRP